MAYTTINKPSDYFNTKLYTGDGNSTQAITGVGFQPDFTWIKSRGTTDGHVNMDSVRGFTSSTKLASYTTAAENGSSGVGTYEGYGYVSAVGSDGFTVNKGTGSGGQVNTSSTNYASWNWLADNTTGSSNTNGTITSTVSANTTSGFSICTYTGNGTSGATFGHGLSSAPEMVILKVRNTTGNWRVGHVGADPTFAQVLNLNLTNAAGTANSIFNSTAPTSSVVTLGNEGDANGNTNTFVAYCFHSVKGYSKFGSYTGNGSADGTFVYTGFKPAMVIIKASSGIADWYILDNKRDPENVVEAVLRPNLTSVESTTINDTDFLSNGFKTRSTSGSTNGSGTTYIYMAFAESPTVTSTGTPTTAR